MNQLWYPSVHGCIRHPYIWTMNSRFFTVIVCIRRSAYFGRFSSWSGSFFVLHQMLLNLLKKYWNLLTGLMRGNGGRTLYWKETCFILTCSRKTSQQKRRIYTIGLRSSCGSTQKNSTRNLLRISLRSIVLSKEYKIFRCDSWHIWPTSTLVQFIIL